MPLPDSPDEFFTKHSIDKASFTNSGLKWTELRAIHDDHTSRFPDLEDQAALLSKLLSRVPVVHSTRFRVKDPEHLVKKIIRKSITAKSPICSADTYRATITDLIGVRALHLFKEEWPTIHTFIITRWALNETPTANIRDGDDASQYKSLSCEIRERDLGYRSVHYIIQHEMARHEYLCEIQVRTLFEEAWSEIDHLVRYPDISTTEILKAYLNIFNRIAGTADEMASFLRGLVQHIKESSSTITRTESDFKSTLARLNISQAETQRLWKMVDDLSRSRSFASSMLADRVGLPDPFIALGRPSTLTWEPTSISTCSLCSLPLIASATSSTPDTCPIHGLSHSTDLAPLTSLKFCKLCYMPLTPGDGIMTQDRCPIHGPQTE